MPKKYLSTRALTGNLGDVRRTNNFVLTIDGVMDGNNLDLIVQQAFLPQVSLQVLEFRHGNDAKKLAGVASWSGGTLTIMDVLSRHELDAILDWFDSIYKVPGTNVEDRGAMIGYAETFINDAGEKVVGYKKTGTLKEFSGSGEFIREWPLEGMWISSLNFGDLDASRGDLKEISATVEIDPSPLRPKYSAGYVDTTPDND